MISCQKSENINSNREYFKVPCIWYPGWSSLRLFYIYVYPGCYIHFGFNKDLTVPQIIQLKQLIQTRNTENAKLDAKNKEANTQANDKVVKVYFEKSQKNWNLFLVLLSVFFSLFFLLFVISLIVSTYL